MAVSLIGVKKVEMADADALGDFPTSYPESYGIRQGTLNLTLAAAELTDIFCEDSAYPIDTLAGNVTDSESTFDFCGVDAQLLADLVGGTYTAADATNPASIDWPLDIPIVYKSVKMTGTRIADGEPATALINKARITISIDSVVTKDDVANFTATIKLVKPNEPGDVPFRWEDGSPTA